MTQQQVEYPAKIVLPRMEEQQINNGQRRQVHGSRLAILRFPMVSMQDMTLLFYVLC